MSSTRWTKEDVATALALRARSYRLEDVAREMGRSYASVKRALQKRSTGIPADREGASTISNARNGSTKLKIAVIRAIVRYANDNGLDVDSAAKRLLSA